MLQLRFRPILVASFAWLAVLTPARGQQWELPWLLKPTLTDCDRLTYNDGKEPLVVVQQGKLFGLKDKNGQPLLNYEYEHITVDPAGLVKARKNGVVEWRTAQGQRFEDARSVEVLSDGRYLVKRGNKLGLMDRSLKVVAPFEYTLTEEGTEMFLEKGTERIPLGPSLLPPDSKPAATTEGGMSQAPEWPGVQLQFDKETRKVAILNKKGKPVNDAQYYFRRGYDFGYAVVSKDNSKWGIVRQDGREMSIFIFDEITGLNNASSTALVREGKNYNLLDFKADTFVRIATSFERLELLTEKPTLFAAFNSKKVVLDARGKELIPMVFDNITREGDFLLGVIDPKQSTAVRGLYSLTGQQIVAPDTVQIQVFFNNTFVVEKQKRLRHLNANGQELTAFEPGTASIFATNWIEVNDATGQRFYHVASTPGHPVWADEVKIDAKGDLQIVKKGDLYGLLHRNGQTLVPTVADEIRFGGRFVYVKYLGKWGVLKNTFY